MAFGRKKKAADANGQVPGGAATPSAPGAPGAPAGSSGMAMLLLPGPVQLQPDQIVGWWAHLWPGVPGPTNPLAPAGGPEGAMAFDLPGGGTAGVGVMPGPLPGLDADQEWTLLWPDFDPAASTAHVVVYVNGPGSPVETLTTLTRLLVAAGSASGALGVHWGASMQVERFDIFSELVTTAFGRGELPLLAWVAFQTMVHEGLSSLATVGMSQFGLMDLEIIDSPRPLDEVHDFASGLVGHLIAQGPVIADGDTVGTPGGEPILVRHAPSAVPREGMVYRLEGY